MAVSVLMAAALGLASAGQLEAQQTPGQEVPDVTEEQLERFATIYPDVVEISRDAQEQLSQTADPDEAQEIQAEANEAIESKLDEVEMDYEEYDGIIRAINADPETLEKFQEIMEEIHGEEPGVGV
ncbi:MAG: DUF4168 domain-containing protein [Longimicrobiales bacterium]